VELTWFPNEIVEYPTNVKCQPIPKAMLLKLQAKDQLVAHR
jgi:hypothetical protein